MKTGTADWRADIDALRFAVSDTGPYGFVHRLAFRTLIGFDPTPGDCLAWFEDHRAAFVAAAEKHLPDGRNFHLNSRDIRRQLGGVDPV